MRDDCNCRAHDARVCWMIRRGEAPGRMPRCGCECHVEKWTEKELNDAKRWADDKRKEFGLDSHGEKLNGPPKFQSWHFPSADKSKENDGDGGE